MPIFPNLESTCVYLLSVLSISSILLIFHNLLNSAEVPCSFSSFIFTSKKVLSWQI
uniref:Uncharacterized protein n=1 Tax=Kuenenia stuttgartiensis TaxID=174633 RepID=Q1Q547_KUEST|nr:unknown protein [Candidatus Kuenenia stuttgartiensis]